MQEEDILRIPSKNPKEEFSYAIQRIHHGRGDKEYLIDNEQQWEKYTRDLFDRCSDSFRAKYTKDTSFNQQIINAKKQGFGNLSQFFISTLESGMAEFADIKAGIVTVPEALKKVEKDILECRHRSGQSMETPCDNGKMIDEVIENAKKQGLSKLARYLLEDLCIGEGNYKAVVRAIQYCVNTQPQNDFLLNPEGKIPDSEMIKEGLRKFYISSGMSYMEDWKHNKLSKNDAMEQAGQCFNQAENIDKDPVIKSLTDLWVQREGERKMDQARRIMKNGLDWNSIIR